MARCELVDGPICPTCAQKKTRPVAGRASVDVPEVLAEVGVGAKGER
jgi:hypothetical protein